MTDPITVAEIQRHDVPAAERLWQLFSHDISQFRDTWPDDNGLFATHDLATYLSGDDPDRVVCLIRSGSHLAGFAAIRGLVREPHVMNAFFVVHRGRRQGLGRQAAALLLAGYPGRWEIPFEETNPGAAAFWRAVATTAVGDRWQAEPRAVHGHPELEPVTWLSLQS